MKVNELRVGNLVLDGKEFITIGADEMLCACSGRCIFEPIPLTEEWLLKFGFECFADGQYEKIFENLDFNWDKETGLYIFLRTQEDNIKPDHIKHVHQLQNLYFALTGEELTIK